MFFYDSNDIVAFKGETIVNSLGAGEFIRAPGRLFRSILDASNDSSALMDEVARKGENLDFGTVFLTDSYGLPCKKILHVVTPFRAFDRGYSKIKACYEGILELALREGIKSIDIPPIGTGANGYRSDKVSEIARRVCYSFAMEHPEMDIFFNVYSVEHPVKEPKAERVVRKRFCEGNQSDGTCLTDAQGMFREPRRQKIEPEIPLEEAIGLEFEDSFATLVRKCVFAKNNKKSKKKQKWILELTWLDINSLISQFKDRERYFKDTVDEIARKTYDDEIEEEFDSLGKKYPHAPQYEWKRNKCKKGGYVWQCPNKAEILFACLALHLTPRETLEVYDFCGYSLSKYDRYDCAFRQCVDYLARKSEIWTHMVQTFHDRTGESIFDYYEPRKKRFVKDPENW